MMIGWKQSAGRLDVSEAKGLQAMAKGRPGGCQRPNSLSCERLMATLQRNGCSLLVRVEMWRSFCVGAGAACTHRAIRLKFVAAGSMHLSCPGAKAQIIFRRML